MAKFKKPRASTIGTPVCHRKRRSWQDDRDLLEELAGLVNLLDGPYDYYEQGVVAFREKIKGFREVGFEQNTEAFFLAMWVRKTLSDLLIKQGNYDLRIHPITFPEDIESVISDEEKKSTQSGFPQMQSGVSLNALFPDPKLRAFALERMQILYRGDLIAYLSSLVSKEKQSLMTFSASIMDLINICQHMLALREISIQKRFSVGETDLWIPMYSMGVEVRNSWSEQEEIEVIRILSNTNFRLRSKYLVLVTPDDLSDESFVQLREIEKRGVFENLSVIRIGDFGSYLDQIVEIEQAQF